ncbi:MAG: TorF family putative porin [Gemmatimonadota bacterium]
MAADVRGLIPAMSMLIGLVSSGQAQVAASLDLTMATPYVWRGLTRANGASLQPEGFLSLGLANGFLSAGAWANYEMGPSSPGNLSDIGSARPGYSEVNLWAQYGRHLGEVETTVGVVHYRHLGTRANARRTSIDNTTELYGGFQLTSTYLVPKLVAYVDVDHVRGVYLEGSATVPLLAYPFGNPIVFYATGLAGFNVSQDVNVLHPDQGATFEKDGLTHFDFSLRATLNLGHRIPLSFNLEPHWQYKIDQFTQRTSPEAGDARRHVQFWFGISASTAVTLIPVGAR